MITSLLLKWLQRLALITGILLVSWPSCTWADSGREQPPYERPADQTDGIQEKEPTEGEVRIERMLGSVEKSTFTTHKLNYGIFGTDDALMQISFKYRLVRDWGLYLAFTNLVKWDLYGNSSPYYDINFMPELFYRFTFHNDWLLSMDTGYWHESNGKADEDDRAWDQLFVRFNKGFKIKQMNLAWETNVYYNLGTGEQNRDIDEYLGWWDTGLFIIDILPTEAQNIDLEFFVWSGKDGNPFESGQFRTGIIYKMKYVAFQPSFYLQYFNGYGEVMLDYDKRTADWRLGLTLIF